MTGIKVIDFSLINSPIVNEVLFIFSEALKIVIFEFFSDSLGYTVVESLGKRTGLPFRKVFLMS